MLDDTQLTSSESAGNEPVWVIDDDRAIRWVLNRALSREGIGCRMFERGQDALSALENIDPVRESRPLVLVSDIRMPGLSGVELLNKVKAIAPDLPVIIMTAFSDLDSAVSAFRGGAFEYLAKPFDVSKAVELISRAMEDARRRAEEVEKAEAQDAEEATQEKSSVPDLIGQAPAMQEVFRAIGRLSQSNVTVLLTGESGAGKEVVARAIWKHSKRNRAPYIAINMAAIPRELLESELFGHEKGAFTGATATRYGRFEQAKGGTLFLDEIGDMPMELQTRLLRVLSNGYFYRVGGHQSIKADVRVIAATNQNLEERVRNGQFREDLYHRLNVIRLRLPPLRDRVEDIEPLATHFLTVGAPELGVEPKKLSAEALEIIRAFPFPGNVRQLENLCRWLLVMAPSQEIRAEDLPYEFRHAEAVASAHPEALERHAETAHTAAGHDHGAQVAEIPADFSWSEALSREAERRLTAGESGIWQSLTDDFERALIRTAMSVTRGRRIEAAERLGLGRNTLTRKIQELGLTDELACRLPPLKRHADDAADGFSEGAA
ncbi:nitrogen regulation protein NR(I) [Sutterella sp.]|uniref:nitrogen regulation protein NR(I) n=1 Tax=Sutterella sp. TaxID=1981025 RepID=UPI0026DEB011|nr:nitrogen regulation protein NR(I) [Sutterella sp.]MDO5531303.1 nitrogen regulation protein NR(I) [Sutterella sp.]